MFKQDPSEIIRIARLTKKGKYKQFKMFIDELTDVEYWELMKVIDDDDKAIKYLFNLLEVKRQKKHFFEYTIKQALIYSRLNKISYETFIDNFPQWMDYKYSQFLKCKTCIDFENCTHEYRCLDIEDIPTPGEEKKDLNQCERAFIYLQKDIDAFNRDLNVWKKKNKIIDAQIDILLKNPPKEIGEISEEEGQGHYYCYVPVTDINDYSKAFATTKREMNKAFLSTDDFEFSGKKKQQYDATKNFQGFTILLRMTERKLYQQQKLLESKREAQPIGKTINFDCTECSNLLNIPDVSKISDSTITQVMECVKSTSEPGKKPYVPKEKTFIEKYQNEIIIGSIILGGAILISMK